MYKINETFYIIGGLGISLFTFLQSLLVGGFSNFKVFVFFLPLQKYLKKHPPKGPKMVPKSAQEGAKLASQIDKTLIQDVTILLTKAKDIQTRKLNGHVAYRRISRTTELDKN